MGEDAVFTLNVVLDELFTNTVRHGGCAGMAQAARIRLSAGDGAVEVEYADRGKPFDPADAPKPDLQAPLEERRRGGLGLHFVREMTSEFTYRRDGEWNRMALRIPVGQEKSK